MAVDSSARPTEQSRRHTRNVASVVPVLPLLPTDKKWRKPSQTVNEFARLDSTASVELDDSEHIPVPAAEPKQATLIQTEVHAESNANELDAQTRDPIPIHHAFTNGLDADSITEDQSANAVVPEDASIPILVEDVAEVSTIEAHEEESRVRPASSTPITRTTDDTLEASFVNQDTPSLHITEHSKHGEESEESLPTDPTQVRSTEEDTQGSDPDNNSVYRSITTGLTDYGSTAGESNLETVILEPQRSSKALGMHHRQSEVAPEALTNGYSSHSSRTDKTSHRMNASISSQPPRLPSLQEHLLFLVTTKSVSDLAIQLNQPDRAYRPTVHNVHSLFVMRSPRVSSLIPGYDQATMSRVINLFPVRNILPHAFDAALRFFYSDQTLTADSLLSPQLLRDKQAKAQSLDYIMSYWIAGVELGLDPIKARAYEFIQQIVSWDTAEAVVKEVQGLRHAAEALPEGHDKYEIRGIADTLLSLIAQLFVEGLNMQDFTLDAEAQVTAFPTRLSHLESRPSNPALSGMIFGSLPAPSTPTTSINYVASAIMLNMQFSELRLLVTELFAWHGISIQNVLLYLVHLREERREQIISNTGMSNKERISHSTAWDPAGWREYIHDGQLNRERVGFLLPTATH